MSSPYQQSNESKGSGGKVFAGCGIGCLVVVIIAVIGAFVAMNYAKSKIQAVADQHLGNAPIEIVEPEANPEAVESAIGRYDAFRDEMKNGGNPGPLVLSAEDINALLFNHRDFSAIAGRAKVGIENDQLSSQVSVGLDEIGVEVPIIGDALKGKYLNGEATFSIALEEGRPSLFIEALNVNGTQVPPEFIEGLRKENLLKEAQKKPEFMKLLEKIEEVSIENDQLRIVPKSGQ